MQLPLFYIYKVLKHKRKIQSNHNRKFQCPFSFCATGYNHKRLVKSKPSALFKVFSTSVYLKSMTSAFGKSFWLKENLLLGWFLALKLVIEMVVQSLPCLIFTAVGL